MTIVEQTMNRKDDNNVDDEAGGDEDDSDIADGNRDGDSAREGDGEDT